MTVFSMVHIFLLLYLSMSRVHSATERNSFLRMFLALQTLISLMLTVYSIGKVQCMIVGSMMTPKTKVCH